MTLEDDLNKMCKVKGTLHNPMEVSKIIAEQVWLVEHHPPAKLGYDTAKNLKNFLKSRKEHGESYPYIERVTEQYLLMYGAVKRVFHL